VHTECIENAPKSCHLAPFPGDGVRQSGITKGMGGLDFTPEHFHSLAANSAIDTLFVHETGVVG